MARLTISTTVRQTVDQVCAGFNRELFLKLNPPFPPVTLQRFDGTEVGDQVHLELDFLLFRQQWISVITESQRQSDEAFFVDEGTSLPFFLRRWRHRHCIKRSENHTVIIDDIEFGSFSSIFDVLLWPALWLQFYLRKPVYRGVFGKP